VCRGNGDGTLAPRAPSRDDGEWEVPCLLGNHRVVEAPADEPLGVVHRALGRDVAKLGRRLAHQHWGGGGSGGGGGSSGGSSGGSGGRGASAFSSPGCFLVVRRSSFSPTAAVRGS